MMLITPWRIYQLFRNCVTTQISLIIFFFFRHVFSTLRLLEKDNNEHVNHYNLDSLSPAITKTIPIATTNRIAYSGLNVTHLKLAYNMYKRGDYDGLKGLFSENVNECPRVSKVNL